MDTRLGNMLLDNCSTTYIHVITVPLHIREYDDIASLLHLNQLKHLASYQK